MQKAGNEPTRRIAGPPAMFAAALVIFALGSGMGAPQARATSRVIAGPGLVEYLGDDQQHRLVVRTSPADIQIRQWFLQLTAAALGLKTQQSLLVSQLSAIRAQIA